MNERENGYEIDAERKDFLQAFVGLIDRLCAAQYDREIARRDLPAPPPAGEAMTTRPAGSRWWATSRSDISSPPCALVVCSAYAVFSKRRQEIMSATEILKSAFTLVVFIAATTTLATAQEATFSEGERLGLAACLSKCPNNDKACNNVCISNSQTKGRVWGDDVRACIRGCRIGTQMKDQILGCITGCRLDRIVR